MAGRAIPLEERFWRHVDKSASADGCWLWTSTLIKGYGRIQKSKTNPHIRAHRFSWELHKSPVPDGMFVLHRCDNPSCVNPDHLFIGTHDDNMKDKAAKGRQMRGEGHYKTKLTEGDVIRMRQLKQQGWPRLRLAQEFGVSKGCVGHIVLNESWTHVAADGG